MCDGGLISNNKNFGRTTLESYELENPKAYKLTPKTDIFRYEIQIS